MQQGGMRRKLGASFNYKAKEESRLDYAVTLTVAGEPIVFAST